MDIKVGDVVAWAKVPDGAMVRDDAGWCALRLRGRGVYVWDGQSWLSAHPWEDDGKWRWESNDTRERVTIISLDVPADATADDLRTLAERFEIREVVTRMPACVHIMASSIEVEGPDFSWERAARRLHRAGWRPGMTAEDAARLLAEVRDGEG